MELSSDGFLKHPVYIIMIMIIILVIFYSLEGRINVKNNTLFANASTDLRY